MTAIRLLRLQTSQDLERVISLETELYPEDEAASPNTIRFRYQEASQYFMCAYLPQAKELSGYIMSTLTNKKELDHASMTNHDAEGSTLCIHSVVVDKNKQRQGIGLAMLKKYINYICSKCHQVSQIMLLAKAYLLEFYIAAGFQVTRLSPVVHGKEHWFELKFSCKEYRQIKLTQVDAFTSELYHGNPAAVVILPRYIFEMKSIDNWMQAVALENNLSETAYVCSRIEDDEMESDANAQFDLRWFTPEIEVDLCGHATLAAAAVLYGKNMVPSSKKIYFHTRSGELICDYNSSSRNSDQVDVIQIKMDFPCLSLTSLNLPPHDTLISALFEASTNVQVVNLCRTPSNDILLHIPAQDFDALQPNFQKLMDIDCRGVIVTSLPSSEILKDQGIDFQSRFFGPQAGINEDPVTGSAHCALARYWGDQLNGKLELKAIQRSSRGGYVIMERNSIDSDRVVLKGDCVFTLDASLAPPNHIGNNYN